VENRFKGCFVHNRIVQKRSVFPQHKGKIRTSAQKKMLRYVTIEVENGLNPGFHFVAPVANKFKGRDTPDTIRQRDAIFQFLKVNKTASERKF
jgi:hypothetical protein